MSNPLKSAIADGIIGAPGYLLNPNLNSYLDKRVPEPLPDRPELQRIALNTKSTNTIKHSFGPQVATFTADNWIELARIPCEFGSLTTLRNVNTFFGDQSGRFIGRSEPSFLEYTWFEYHLSYTQIEPAPQRIKTNPYIAGVNPGVPLFELPLWNDNRFDSNINPDEEITIPLTPGRSLSLFARLIGAEVPDLFVWQPDFQFKKGDVVFGTGFNTFLCTIDHLSAAGNAPGVANGPWSQIADIATGYPLMLWGELEASVQSEQNLSAKWQAERDYQT